MPIDFVSKMKKQLIKCLVIVHLKELNVDKEAWEAAEKPAKQSEIFLSTHKPAPPSVPLQILRHMLPFPNFTRHRQRA